MASPSPITMQSLNRTGGLISAKPFFAFPDGKQAENMIVRANGQILVTLDTAPELYQVNPFLNQTGEIIHRFEGYTSLFGIVEADTDIFYLIASNFSGPPDYYGYEGSVGILEVDLRDNPETPMRQSAVIVSKALDVPRAQLLDGLTIIDKRKGLLMSGDAQTGTLYLINVRAHTSIAVLQDELLSGTSTEATAGLAHVGVNGLKLHKGGLYFTNTAKGLFGRVPIDVATSKPAGKPVVLANYGNYVDDFSFDSSGNLFISEDSNGVLLRPVDTTAATNATRLLSLLPGADSNAFGKTALDRCILYSTFAGAVSGVASINVRMAGLCN